jgi:tetratricopeptide (TPR) repeat protein
MRRARRRPTWGGKLRLWLFRLLSLLLIPALFLLLSEGSLRLIGYGHATAFFVRSADGQYWESNSDYFGTRFFLRERAPKPWHATFPVEKAPGTCRMFILGGSAALGVPSHPFAFWRILDRMLTEAYPDTHFEVVNTAFEAINSHVVLPIARECTQYSPDVFVIYLGNNEVVGPFGPGTIFSAFSPTLSLIRLSLSARATRVGQLFQSVLGGPLGTEDVPEGAKTGVELFSRNFVTATDPRMERVHAYYRRNLEDLLRATDEAGVHVILCTVAVNLRDCPPFGSAHRLGLAAAEEEQWKELYEEGCGLEADGSAQEALRLYSEALRLDEQHADLRFRLGKCHLAVGNTGQAREQLVLARDLDSLRLRADSRINEIVRGLAVGTYAGGVRLVDAEAVIAADPLVRDGVPGEEVFYDHVHLNFDGNYALAKAVFQGIEPVLPASVREGRARERTVPGAAECAQLLGLTVVDKWRTAAYITQMMERPPFTYQTGHNERLGKVRADLAELAARRTPEALDATLAQLLQLLDRYPDDQFLRKRLAEFAQLRERLAEQGEADASAEPVG